MNQIEPNEAHHAFFAAYDATAPRRLEAVYTADAVHRDVALDKETSGREAIVAGFTNFLASFSEAAWVARRSVFGPGVAATSYLLEGTLMAPLAGFEPAGQRIRLPGLMVLETEGPLVSSSTDHWNLPTLLSQLENA